MKKIKLFVNEGFSLIELIVTITIIIILFMIAIPSYNEYVLKSNRIEMHSELIAAVNEINKFKIREGYLPIGNNIKSFYKSKTRNGLYRLSYCAGNSCDDVDLDYIVTATAQKGQKKDTLCSNNKIKVKGAIMTKTPEECWV